MLNDIISEMGLHVLSSQFSRTADLGKIALNKCEGATLAHMMLKFLTLNYFLTIMGTGEREERAHWPVVLRNIFKTSCILVAMLACIGSL